MDILQRAWQQLLKPIYGVLAGPFYAPHPRQSFFFGRNPIVQKHRVVDQEGGHAKPCGISNSKFSTQAWIKHNGALATLCAGHMFDKIQCECAYQKDRQHLYLKRALTFVALFQRFPIRRTKFSRSIHRSGAH